MTELSIFISLGLDEKLDFSMLVKEKLYKMGTTNEMQDTYQEQTSIVITGEIFGSDKRRLWKSAYQMK